MQDKLMTCKLRFMMIVKKKHYLYTEKHDRIQLEGLELWWTAV